MLRVPIPHPPLAGVRLNPSATLSRLHRRRQHHLIRHRPAPRRAPLTVATPVKLAVTRVDSRSKWSLG
ncbi:MAG: hypothetical protein OK454_12305, partial [Thaumarchaeota archaeon]|nr:hypothetical protein [Nitrososphaerota archaeon]